MLFLSSLLSGGFDPSKLANMVLWLRSDLGITKTGSNITGWADQSGRGNNAIVALGANGPTISAGALNGHDVLAFASASTQALQIPAGGSNDLTTGLTSNALSVFAVWNWTGSNGAGFQCVINATPSGAWSNNWCLGNGPGGASGQLEFWESFYDTVGPPASFVGITQNSSAYRCNVGVYDPTSLIHLYNDGSDNSATAQAIFSRTAAPTIIGGYTSVIATTTAGYLDGHIAELAVFNRALTATEAGLLHGYSQSRYGTP